MYNVYILRNKYEILYKGLTNNVSRRLKQHNSNKCIGTRGKGPWDLVHVEVCKDRNEARKLEKYYKSGTGREILKELLSTN